MSQLPLLHPNSLRSGLIPNHYLLHVPYEELGDFAARLDRLVPKPDGLVPPLSPDLNTLARTMATVRDFFKEYPLYAPIFRPRARDFLRASRGAGFTHFILPFSDPFPHFYQEVHDLLGGKMVHVAGVAEDFPEWLAAKGLKWTWSVEPLL